VPAGSAVGSGELRQRRRMRPGRINFPRRFLRFKDGTRRTTSWATPSQRLTRDIPAARRRLGRQHHGSIGGCDRHRWQGAGPPTKGNTARPIQPPNPFRLTRLLRRPVACRAAISATAVCSANSVRESFFDFGAPATGWSSKCGKLGPRATECIRRTMTFAPSSRCRSSLSTHRTATMLLVPARVFIRITPPVAPGRLRIERFDRLLDEADPWRIKDNTSASRNLPAWQVTPQT
jgi:hypothetical protein